MITAALLLLTPPPMTWTPLGEPGVGGAMTDIAVSPHDPKRVLVCGDMLGIGLSTDGGDSYGPTFGLRSYETGSVTFHPKDPKIVWAGTMGGPHLSVDGGKTWQLRRNGLPEVSEYSFSAPIEKVLFDPTDSSRILAIGGSSRRWDAWNDNPAWGAVWQSRDSGKNWIKLGQIGNPAVVANPHGAGRNLIDAAFAAKSGKRVYGLVHEGGFYRSDDGGRTWTPRGKGIVGKNVRRLVADATRPNVIWVSTGPSAGAAGEPMLPGGVFASTDGGETFKPITNGLAQNRDKEYVFTSGYPAFSVSATNPNVMLTSDNAWNTGVFYISNNGGKNWMPVATKGNVGHGSGKTAVPVVKTAMFAGLGAGVSRISPTNPKLMFGVNTEWIIRSVDGGKTWIDASSKPKGDGWVGRGYTGWCSRQIRFDLYRKGRSIVQAMDAARAWVSHDGQASWKYGEGFDNPWNCGTDAAWTRSGRVYAGFGQFSNFGGLGVSDDGGLNWKVCAGAAAGLPELGAKTDPSGVAADPHQPDRAWASVGGALYTTKNGGKNWSRVPMSGYVNYFSRAGKTLYAATHLGVMATTDGEKWKAIGGPKGSDRCDAAPDGTLYVAARGDRPGIWRYRKGVWNRRLDEPLVRGVAVDPKNTQRLIATTSRDPFMDLSPSPGVYLSDDGGASWKIHNDGLAMLRADCAAFDPFGPGVVLGTGGRGFWKMNWPVGTMLAGAQRRTYESSAEDAKFAEVSPWGLSTPVVVQNGDMSAGSSTADGWGNTWVGRGQVTAARDTTEFKSSPASLRVDAKSNAQGQFSQVVESAGGTRFRLRAQLKSKGNVTVLVALQPFTADWKPMPFVNAGFARGDSGWSKIEADLTVPDGAARFGLVLYVEGDGSAWLDDVETLPASD